MRASNRVSASFGGVAVQRGSLVYCVQEADNEKPFWTHQVKMAATPKYHYEANLLKGIGN
ncbi:hypothetical protein YK48G_21820 [Lentilactobacillus fungorum]|jgi:DUF1680 family protein|uniref:Non-reducing end beta-L-arabinofuranosidase-like GH127 C-terminal domain-containing protein n=1 Tax=Lentilactobacillus fungorum TaxID=2201250 RepID=A0ABQ3W2Q4_9LACO|nr:hypothetical protein YK48G_21820 [Lentilactobacillus fungorum]